MKKNPICKCGKELRKKTNKKTGTEFWGCVGFPTCKITYSIGGQNEIEPFDFYDEVPPWYDDLRPF